MIDQKSIEIRDEKIENLIKNHSMIFMAMFEEAFTSIADKMTEVLASGTAAMAEALGAMSSGSENSRSTNLSKKVKDEISPEVRSQIGNVFSKIREEMSAQWPKNSGLFKQFISNPDFDNGIKIVEKNDFGRPRLTEKLSDEVLASYVLLLKSENRELGMMFKELADWQAGLPKPPWARQKID